MLRQIPPVEQFKQQLRQETQHRTLQFAKQTHTYTCGDQEEHVSFIESGQVKLLMLSPAGNECLLTVLSAGDIYGLLCLP